jgi:hypothetical protein
MSNFPFFEVIVLIVAGLSYWFSVAVNRTPDEQKTK